MNGHLRMYCIDTKALVFMFNEGSSYGFTIPSIFIPLLVYTNHINNEKHVHHGFLAPRTYLCSTSLTMRLNNKSRARWYPKKCTLSRLKYSYQLAMLLIPTLRKKGTETVPLGCYEVNLRMLNKPFQQKKSRSDDCFFGRVQVVGQDAQFYKKKGSL